MKQQKNREALPQKTEKKEGSSGRSKVLTILGIVLCVILLPILILNMILIIQGFGADKSKLPNIGGYFPLMVQSGSMSGTIETGDLIIVHTIDEKDAENLKKDDVVTFWENQPGGALVTHRILEVTEDDKGQLVYVTKGDANPAADSRDLYPEKIVGTYVTRLAGLGDVAMFMQTIPGLIICVVLPLALFIAYDIIRRRRIDKSNKQETDVLLAELEELKRLQAEKNNAQAEQAKPEAAEVKADSSEQEAAESKKEDTGSKAETAESKSE